MVEQVRDHWYWRPGWRAGRSFYTWHITFQNDAVLSDLHAAYQPVVRSLPGLTPVPAQWLHLTLQGVGFADKLTQEDLDPIVEAAQRRLEPIHAFESGSVPPSSTPKASRCRSSPSTDCAVSAPNSAPRSPTSGAATPSQRSRSSIHTSPSATGTRAADAAPLKKRLAALGGGVAKTEITQASLINLNRDHHCYEWTTYATVRLGVLVTSDQETRP